MNFKQKRRFSCSSLTDVGRTRSNNEDRYLELPARGVWAVADGMGGHASGEVASQIVIETLQQVLASSATAVPTLEAALKQAHTKILLAAKNNPKLAGMGSTAVVLSIFEQHYEIAWVGDSRAYCWTPSTETNGELLQLTTDHSLVQALVDKDILTPAEAATHPEKHVITQCLGAQGNTLSIDKITGTLLPQQWLLLCSDGLTNELTDQDIADHLEQSKDINHASKQLLDAALAAGGKDNITLQLIGQTQSSLLSNWVDKVKTTLHTSRS